MSSVVKNFKTELHYWIIYKAMHNSGLSKTYTGLDLEITVEIYNAHKNNFNFVVGIYSHRLFCYYFNLTFYNYMAPSPY